MVHHRAALDAVLNGNASALAREHGEPRPLLQAAVRNKVEHLIHFVAHEGELLRVFIVHVFNFTLGASPPTYYAEPRELPDAPRVLAFVKWVCSATQLDGLAFIQARVRGRASDCNASD